MPKYNVKRPPSLAERESLNKLIRLPRETFVKVLVHSRSKYMPHQGMKECSRRIVQDVQHSQTKL